VKRRRLGDDRTMEEAALYGDRSGRLIRRRQNAGEGGWLTAEREAAERDGDRDDRHWSERGRERGAAVPNGGGRTPMKRRREGDDRTTDGGGRSGQRERGAFQGERERERVRERGCVGNFPSNRFSTKTKRKEKKIKENVKFTTPIQQPHNNNPWVDFTHWGPPSCEVHPHVRNCCDKKNVRFTTPIQQLYNNPSHESRSHILGPPSCEGLLYSCYISVVQESNLIVIVLCMNQILKIKSPLHVSML
jgi:hypothetical protein